jgi:AraC-like DNA-binding protein
MHNPDAKSFGTLPSATGFIARLAYARLKAAAVEPGPLLKKAGVTLPQIEDPSARLRAQDQIRFLNFSASMLTDDLLGFHLAQQPDLREIGILYYILASSEFLGLALQRAARYTSIVNEGISVKVVDGPDMCITFAYVGVSRHLDRHQIEFWMTALVRMCRQLTGLRLLPTRVRLTHHRDGTCSELVEFFGTDVEFGATVDAVEFAASVKHMPVVSADPYLNQLVTACCEEALSHQSTRHGSFRSKVENAIVPLLPHGKARVGEIARRLGVSQRTFGRRLSLEGRTFSDVLEELRSDLAGRYLADNDLSISQVAWLLGYKEVSAFTHAFKRWTGKTPRHVRSGVESVSQHRGRA